MIKKNDVPSLLGFGALGLVVAYFVSEPIRRPQADAPQVGTPLAQASARVYAEGVIQLAKGAENKAKDKLALFIIAKSIQGGPPLAVKRIEFPKFPYRFTLTQNDSMIKDMDFFEGDLVIKARLDQDGSAGPLTPDDLEGSVELKTNQPRQVTITIDS